MAFVGRRAADLLLGGIQALGQFFLGDARFFAQTGNLKCDVPRFASRLEALGEVRVLELFLQVAVEIRLLHPLTCHIAARPR